MNEKVVIVSNDYDRIDGRNAYQSDIKRLTLGAPMLEENKEIVAELCREMGKELKAIDDPWYKERILSDMISY